MLFITEYTLKINTYTDTLKTLLQLETTGQKLTGF